MKVLPCIKNISLAKARFLKEFKLSIKEVNLSKQGKSNLRLPTNCWMSCDIHIWVVHYY